MRSAQARLVTLCQQVLTLGVVAAVLTPAATVLPLDVVAPGTAPGAAPAGPGAAEAVAEVETEPVRPVVTEQPLTAEPGAAARGATLPRVRTTPAGEERVLGEPAAVDGFGTVGVTWDGREQLEEGELAVEVRTRGDSGGWSAWDELEYHDDHAPDPGSREARRARPGTEPLVVGEVDDVQVRATGEVPADLTVAVVDPGESAGTELAAPAIDTAEATGSGPGSETGAGAGSADAAPAAATVDGSGAVLSAGVSAPKPKIFSRAQWGADERLRDRGSLRYGTINAGFVHHTVNGNSYTKAQVPGILRSIYAYHTRSRGWSDVGYNFLVDKFGRIWEGRYGGVARPVIGAHTYGYNHASFAGSAIGNFETTRPPQAMLSAYGRLFAWKLSLHGIRADSSNQQVAGRTFRAINGHRDAGSTACPGRYLYARLSTIRSKAVEGQRAATGSEREVDLVDSKHPDIALRRASDKQIFLLPTGGLTGFAKARVGASGWAGRTPVPTPDVDGDGRNDVVATGNGKGVLWSGDGAGGFSRTRTVKVFSRKELLSAVGDLDGDGRNDFVGRRPNGMAAAFPGLGRGAFRAVSLGMSWSDLRMVSGVGDVTGDDRVDVVARDADGDLQLLAGDGDGGFEAPTAVPGSWGRYDRITGFGDYNRDGHGDLFARGHGGAGWVVPGRGDGTFMRRFGPVWKVRGLAGLASGGNVAGSAAPDLVGVQDGSLQVLRNTGRYDASAPRPTGLFLAGANVLLNVGDWDGDGDGDLVSRHWNGVLRLHPGDGKGGFAPQRRLGTGFRGVRRLTSVGDATGDGRPDIMGQPKGGSVQIYPGRGLSGIGAGYAGSVPTASRLDVRPYDWVISLGGKPGSKAAVAARQKATGVLWRLHSNAKGKTKRRFLAEGIDAYDKFGR